MIFDGHGCLCFRFITFITNAASHTHAHQPSQASYWAFFVVSCLSFSLKLAPSVFISSFFLPFLPSFLHPLPSSIPTSSSCLSTTTSDNDSQQRERGAKTHAHSLFELLIPTFPSFLFYFFHLFPSSTIQSLPSLLLFYLLIRR